MIITKIISCYLINLINLGKIIEYQSNKHNKSSKNKMATIIFCLAKLIKFTEQQIAEA